MPNVDFNTLIEDIDIEDVSERFSTAFALPSEGDIFELHIDDTVEQYQYIGGNRAVGICQVLPEYKSHLAEGRSETFEWDSLLAYADDMLDGGNYVWGEIVFGNGVTSPDLRAKIETLQEQLSEVEMVDPVVAVQIANTIEFLES